jgi:hypothetical protein
MRARQPVCCRPLREVRRPLRREREARRSPIRLPCRPRRPRGSRSTCPCRRPRHRPPCRPRQRRPRRPRRSRRARRRWRSTSRGRFPDRTAAESNSTTPALDLLPLPSRICAEEIEAPGARLHPIGGTTTCVEGGGGATRSVIALGNQGTLLVAKCSRAGRAACAKHRRAYQPRSANSRRNG